MTHSNTVAAFRNLLSAVMKHDAERVLGSLLQRRLCIGCGVREAFTEKHRDGCPVFEAASILGVVELTGLCEICGNPATLRDMNRFPICTECAKTWANMPTPESKTPLVQIFHITKSDEPKLKGLAMRDTMCGISVPGNLVVKDPHAQRIDGEGCQKCYIAYRRLGFRYIGH